MSLRLYNTLTRQKEEFKPLDPTNVRMYVCGPTVYDFAHIGNARPVIVFDVLYRLLRHIYGAEHVKYVRNITDVDDKINARALRDFPDLPLNDAIARVTAKTADQFQTDAKALGCLVPTEEPRATDNIAGMIEIISTLINKGHAYVAGGEVLFSVGSMKEYGQLSNRKLDEQQAGARVAVEAHKKNPADFVLWKLSSADEPGWDSPWGRGRPGWHIECSAMSKRYLGEVFDIHGGGLDLIFPHHENEIAQSRCAHGTSVMANVWMHNGFLQVEGQKMSKSLGNFYTIAELMETEKFGGRKWSGNVLRLAMLMTHYREPIDFSLRKLQEAQNILNRWSSMIDCFYDFVPEGEDDEIIRYYENKDLEFEDEDSEHTNFSEYLNEFSEDLNFSRFMGRIQGDITAINLGFQGLTLSRNQLLKLKHDTRRLVTRVLVSFGFQLKSEIKIDRDTIVDLINDRLLARHNKNWKESDRIRDELDAMGIGIKDNKDGTTSWEVER
jgi:cysteinyl-tRNA synthetase